MTKADDTQADIDFALDFVLGVLREPELSFARINAARNGAFATLVACQRRRLYPDDSANPVEVDAEQPEVPREVTWEAIVARTSVAANS